MIKVKIKNVSRIIITNYADSPLQPKWEAVIEDGEIERISSYASSPLHLPHNKEELKELYNFLGKVVVHIK